MNDNLKSFIKISEEINNNLADNVFELNIPNANLIESTHKTKSNNLNEFNEMSLNISNLDITKLIQLFKINKKALKDFFKLQIFEFRPADELIIVIREFSDVIDNNTFENLFNFCIENSHLELLESVIERSKEFILENDIPTLFEFLSKVDLKKSEIPEANLNGNKNSALAANTPKKNSSAKKENGSNMKNNNAENKRRNNLVNIFKNIFEISFDSSYLINQYKEREFSYFQLKELISTLNYLLINLIEEIKTLHPSDNSELMKIYENIIGHFTIFGLLNEVYLHKANQAEEEYNTLKREIKALTDIVKKLKTALEKSLSEESSKKDLADVKRKINAFRNYGLQQDVIYETINL